MRVSDSRNRVSTWRRIVAALMLVMVLAPLSALPADASAADQLTVRVNSPKKGETISGFIIVNFTVNPRHQLAVPARRENTNLRTWGVFYAPGETTNPDDFNAWYFDSWTYRGGVAAAGNARANRDTFVPPGFGSVRPPRVGTRAWDTTVVADGPATIMVRGWGIDGSYKDAYVTVNVANKGSSPDYTDFVAPKNGDTVSGWVPLVVTAMPRRNGIQRGIQNTRWVTFLPSCLDIDINYWKLEYAQGANPAEANILLGQTDYISWAWSDYGYQSYHDMIPQDGKVRITPAGCPGTPVQTYNGGTNWNSTLVPDGPATIRFTVVYNDGGLRQYNRVVNVQNKGQGVQYFGLDRDALAKAPLSGDNAGIPGYADVPFRGVPEWTYQLPTAYHACDIAAGDVTASPNDAGWTMFWINDNDTWNAERDDRGFTIRGDMRPKDWTSARSFGRSGALCRLDTSDLTNGIYTIRLRLSLTNGTTQIDMVPVTVKN